MANDLHCFFDLFPFVRYKVFLLERCINKVKPSSCVHLIWRNLIKHAYGWNTLVLIVTPRLRSTKWGIVFKVLFKVFSQMFNKHFQVRFLKIDKAVKDLRYYSRAHSKTVTAKLENISGREYLSKNAMLCFESAFRITSPTWAFIEVRIDGVCLRNVLCDWQVLSSIDTNVT